MMRVIMIITTQASWDKAHDSGKYESPSLATEGFIHACSPEQVSTVANRYFRGQKDLVLLKIDERLVKAEVRYEEAPSDGQLYPHIYGPLNTDAVVDVLELYGD